MNIINPWFEGQLVPSVIVGIGRMLPDLHEGIVDGITAYGIRNITFKSSIQRIDHVHDIVDENGVDQGIIHHTFQLLVVIPNLVTC